MSEKETVKEAFERIKNEHPIRMIKCPYCHGESFTAHLSDDNHLALYCDACEEQVFACNANDIIGCDVLELKPAKKKRRVRRDALHDNV